ncbi:hypothetical protein Rmf_48570 [Roseomonas fluvialis]|uniref:Uncharacterized protein n=1 Tax=Roseomonas fluvialis TaxID=1750527 RepID=A0ABN6PBK4_9PROT|nr:hypothetical protein Rmf_48570 [Roseomonas fluvialis]
MPSGGAPFNLAQVGIPRRPAPLLLCPQAPGARLRGLGFRAARWRAGRGWWAGRGRAVRSRIAAGPRSAIISALRCWAPACAGLAFAPCAGVPGAAGGLGAVALCAPGSR